MPYVLIKTNGTTLTTVQDGTLDNTTSLTFVGKNFTGYGDPVNENLLKLLENFSNTRPPTSPLTGQLWFDSKSNKLKFYNGIGFNSIAVVSTGTNKPATANIADLHFDGTLLWAYTGTSWLRIGPLGGTGSDNSSLPTSIVFVAGGGINTAIPININGNTSTVFSTTASYTVSSDDLLFNSFNQIYPGINLSNTSNIVGSGITPDTRGISGYYDGTLTHGNLFWGTAGSALGLVDYSNSTQKLLRSSDFVIKDSLTHLESLSLSSDDGITINNVFQLHVTRETGIGESNISNIKNNVIKFNINDASNGTYTNFINFDARSGHFNVLPTTATDVSLGASGTGNSFSDIYVKNIHATTATLGSLTVANTIIAASVQLSTLSTINGSAILTAASLSNNTQLYNGAGYLTSATISNFAVSSLSGTTGQILSNTSSGIVTLSLADTVNVHNISSTGTISANAMLVQGSPVLTAATFNGTGVSLVLGTANQISVNPSGTQVTLSLSNNLQVGSLNANVLTVRGVPVLTSGNAVSSLYPGSTGLLLNNSAGITTGDITLSGVLNSTNGGTGQGTYAIGDILYAGSNNPVFLSKLSAVGIGNTIISQGVYSPPAWGKISLTSHIVDTLPATNGGTGQSTYAMGDILYAGSSNPTSLSKLSAVSYGSALLSQGTTTVPAWGKISLVDHVTGTLSTTNGGTGNAGTLTGYVHSNGASSMSASASIPGTAISGNITGNSTNITNFTVNQNVGTTDSPTFANLTIPGTANFASQVSVPTATAPTSAVNLGQFYPQTKSSNGYITFPGGLILQWATFSGSVKNAVSHDFPEPFPTTCFFCMGNYSDTSGLDNGTSNMNVSNFNRTSFSITWNGSYSSGGSGDSALIKVFAIGM